MYGAKFIGGFNTSEKVPLYYIVSMGNPNQTGEAFVAFVDLVNKHKERISRLIIVPSGWLHRHYVGEEVAIQMSNEWKTLNQATMEKLEVQYSVTEWYNIINNQLPQYRDAMTKVNDLYEQNKDFKLLVDDLAKKNQDKVRIDEDRLKAARAYTLEDTLAALLLSGDITYPAKTLNPAITYVAQTFNSQLKYTGYALHLKPQKRIDKANNSSDLTRQILLMNSCLSTVKLMKKFGLNRQEDQEGFFKQFLVLIDTFPKNRTLENGTEFSRPTSSAKG